MITTLINKKQGLNRFSKLVDDEVPWEPTNLLKPRAKEKYLLKPGGPNNRQEAPAPTN